MCMVGEKGGGMLGWGPIVCVTVKKIVPQKQNQKKCSDSWQNNNNGRGEEVYNKVSLCVNHSFVTIN